MTYLLISTMVRALSIDLVVCGVNDLRDRVTHTSAFVSTLLT